MSDFSIFTIYFSSFLWWWFFFCVSGGEKKRSGSAQILIGWLGFPFDWTWFISYSFRKRTRRQAREPLSPFGVCLFFPSFFKQVNTHMKSKTGRLPAALAAVLYAQRAYGTIRSLHERLTVRIPEGEKIAWLRLDCAVQSMYSVA